LQDFACGLQDVHALMCQLRRHAFELDELPGPAREYAIRRTAEGRALSRACQHVSEELSQKMFPRFVYVVMVRLLLLARRLLPGLPCPIPVAVMHHESVITHLFWCASSWSRVHVVRAAIMQATLSYVEHWTSWRKYTAGIRAVNYGSMLAVIVLIVALLMWPE
jgi:hypothetical protein